MKKKAKISIFCMIFVAGTAFCQKVTYKPPIPRNIFTIHSPFQDHKRPASINYFSPANNKMPAPVKQTPFFIIGADHYTRNFGFFCRKELQFEKATGLPFKFRLGSVQYCDWLEGKRTAGVLPQ